jgi:ubiquinone/menaquinone biosynthesis C-methylase UbiE
MIFQELLSGIQGGTVLDIGCGSGQFIEILVHSLGAYEFITGIDVDETALKEASDKFQGDSFSFIKASSQALPFEDGVFDLVSISKTLHHVENDRQTLVEMKRVLRPGGYFLVTEMIRDGLSRPQESHLLYHHLRAEIDQLIGVSHHETYYRSDLLDLIGFVGLQELTIREFQPEGAAPDDPANIDEFIGKMKGWLEEITGHPQHRNFMHRMAVLEEHIRENGISRPTQVIALGRKIE